MRRVSTPLFIAVLGLALIPLLALALFGGPAATPGVSPSGSGPVASGSGAAIVGTPGTTDSASPASASPAPTADPSPAVPDGPVTTVAFVPVVDFRSTATDIGAADIAAVAAGTDKRWTTIEIVGSDASGILAALSARGVPTIAASRVVRASGAAAVARDLAKDSKRIAFLRASQVTPALRALAWSGRSLFGVDRVKAAASWKLTARLRGDAHPFDPAATWTIVAGGDILLDRGVYKQVHILGKGADFPFDGGTAKIVGRHCCSSFGWPVPTGKRTGNAGAVRHLLTAADIAVANFENPAPNTPHYHTQGTVFSADPRLISGLSDAGIDIVSIANNHIGDAGKAGILQTIANLDKNGIKHAGAGKNAAAAHKPAVIKVGGIRVAILAYDTIARYYTAGVSTPGSARLTAAGVKTDVAAARAAGANLVIVYPHWGTEYDPTPFPAQQALAHAVIDAGADMIIGNHAHWVGAMEVYKGRPIWYALGNFVFDQVWSEPTQEGLILELTFNGSHLVQAQMHPTLILDQAQPNLLDPAGDGRVVLGQLYDASKGLLPW
ncbi:MAG TPA: CapA family protein [Candidatus Limnocylindrales bacterium]